MIRWAAWRLLPMVGAVFFIAVALLVYQCRRALIIAHLLDPYNRWLAHFSPVRKVIKIILWATACLMLCLAALRPQWGQQDKRVQTKARDLFIALDVSRSMLARDVSPDRITAAVKKLQTLIDALGSDRVGLIFFAGSAIVQCPLTQDKELVRLFLEQAKDSIGSSSTQLEQALEVLLEQVTDGDLRTKIGLVVTDGEDFSHNLTQVRKKVQELGLALITMGIGTSQGAQIPVTQNGITKPLLDEQDKPVISKLNEATLKSLAVQTGGFYLTMTTDNTDVATILAHVQKHELQALDEIEQSGLIDRYPWFALVGLLLLVFEWVL